MTANYLNPGEISHFNQVSVYHPIDKLLNDIQCATNFNQEIHEFSKKFDMSCDQCLVYIVMTN